jgi:hypothetical protein
MVNMSFTEVKTIVDADPRRARQADRRARLGIAQAAIG